MADLDTDPDSDLDDLLEAVEAQVMSIPNRTPHVKALQRVIGACKDSDIAETLRYYSDPTNRGSGPANSKAAKELRRTLHIE